MGWDASDDAGTFCVTEIGLISRPARYVTLAYIYGKRKDIWEDFATTTFMLNSINLKIEYVLTKTQNNQPG